MTDLDQIHSDLAVLKSQHATFQKTLDEHSGREDSFQREMRECLIGNGKSGINTRLDRIEQREVNRSKSFWLLAAAVMTALADNVWHWFKFSGKS